MEIPFLPDVPVIAAIVEHDAVERVRRLKPLSLLPLVALIFYDVSGGPFGIEARVQLMPCFCEPRVLTSCVRAGCGQHRRTPGSSPGLLYSSSHLERAGGHGYS